MSLPQRAIDCFFFLHSCLISFGDVQSMRSFTYRLETTFKKFWDVETKSYLSKPPAALSCFKGADIMLCLLVSCNTKALIICAEAGMEKCTFSF